MSLDGVPVPQEVEVVGLLEAIKWLGVLVFKEVIVELDCKTVMDASMEIQTM